MKKIAFLFVMIASFSIKAQIALEHHYPVINNFGVIKLHQAGYKYLMVDIPGSQMKLYNTNHSLYKTITIPSIICTNKQVYAVTDQLYNTNSLIEFGLSCVTQTQPPNVSITYTFFVFDENGTLLFQRDSATIVQTMSGTNPMINYDPIYSIGNSTKLKLGIGNPALYHEIYALPGSIPCTECIEGSMGIVGVQPVSENQNEIARFFPNPANNQLKLKYTLPEGTQKAEIKIYDLQGKLLDQLTITNDFDFIYLPSNYNSGLYLYSLLIDDKVIKTEKIILSH
jgi:hypothetical protein